jgi:hypothetical protein
MALPALKLHSLVAPSPQHFTAEQWLAMLATMQRTERLRAYQLIEETTKKLDGPAAFAMSSSGKEATRPKGTRPQDDDVTAAVSLYLTLHANGVTRRVAAWFVNVVYLSSPGSAPYKAESYKRMGNRLKKTKRVRCFPLSCIGDVEALFIFVRTYQHSVSKLIKDTTPENEPSICKVMTALLRAEVNNEGPRSKTWRPSPNWKNSIEDGEEAELRGMEQVVRESEEVIRELEGKKTGCACEATGRLGGD